MEPYPEHAQEPVGPWIVGLLKGLSTQATTHHLMHQGQSVTGLLPAQHILDKKAASFLQDLEATVEQIPSNIPNATPEHWLSIFAAD
jgi:hypothetical protein